MLFLIIVLSYLLGSIPTAYIAGRITRGRDIRQMGDKNMGAANAFRELGAGTGIVVGLVDAAKGALAVMIAHLISPSQFEVLLAGTAAVIGHNFTVFLGFKGGRGVSTSIGVLAAVVTLPVVIMAIPAIITLIITRSVTKAMAVLFIPLSALGWWLGLSGMLIGYSIFLPCLVGLTHYLRTRHIPASLNP